MVYKKKYLLRVYGALACKPLLSLANRQLRVKVQIALI